MVQYNPNPNATSNLTGWTKGGSATTLTATSEGARWVGGASGTGRYVKITVNFDFVSSIYWRVGGLSIRRNSGTARIARVVCRDGVYTSTQYSTTLTNFALGSANFVTFGTLPHADVALSSGDFVSVKAKAEVFIFAEDNKAFDFHIKGVNVYGNGQNPSEPDLDSNDAGFNITQSANSKTISTAYIVGNEAVDTCTWNWGDGTANTSVAASVGTASHTYANPGVYTVTMTATGRYGIDGSVDYGVTPITDTFSSSKSVTVPIGTFTAGFSGQTDFLHLDVDASSSVAPSLSPIDTYAWNWGDGTTTAANSSKYAAHDFAQPGTYNVTLTVKDNATNRTATVTKNFTVSSPPNPDNYFLANKELLSVSFIPSIQDGTTYAWIFGDGETSDEKEPTHNYELPGTYSVTLTVNGTLTTTQTVTVVAQYATLKDLTDALRLEVAVPHPSDSPHNLLKNSSGELGAWGWKTPTAGSTMIGSTTDDKVADRGIAGAKLIFQSSGTGSQYFESARVKVVPGQYVAGQIQSPYVDGYYRLRVDVYDAAGTRIVLGAYTGYMQASPSATVRTTPIVLPAGSATATIIVKHTSDTGEGTPLAGKLLQVRRAMIATAATSAELTSLPYSDATDWQDLIGPTAEISVSREALDVGTLSATILDSTFDPATNGTIRPGQTLRLRAKTQDSSGNLQWSSIFTGTVTDADVDYVGAKGSSIDDVKKTKIKIAASDAITALARITQPKGVAKVDELPELLEGVEVPYQINGATGQVPTVQVVSWNENASLIDQIAITRDTNGGYAYVDRDNVLQAREPAYMPTTAVGVIDERAFSDVAASFNTGECINSVTIKWLRYTAASGGAEASVEEVTYGPYTDEDSIAEWGLRPATFTMQGVENPATIASKAAAILAANAQPARMISGVTLPIRFQEDITEAKALLDLYDLVHLAYQRTETDDEVRVTSISHKITPRRWTMSLGFSANGTVASPQVVARPPSLSDTGTPHAARYKSASTTDFPVAATVIDMNAAESMRGGMTYTATNGIKVPRSGIYSVSFCAHVQSTGTTGSKTFFVRRNVTTGIMSYASKFDGTNESDALSRNVYLDAGDEVSVALDHSGAATGVTVYGATSAGTRYTYLEVTYVGP